MAAVWVAFLAAALTVAANLFLRVWQYRREHWVARAERCIELVNTITETACEYWSELSKNDADTAKKIAREAKIIGLSGSLDGLFIAMAPFWDDGEETAMSSVLSSFQDAVGGGEFQTSSTVTAEAAAARARLIHSKAADFTIGMREVIDSAVSQSFWGRAWRRAIPTQVAVSNKRSADCG